MFFPTNILKVLIYCSISIHSQNYELYKESKSDPMRVQKNRFAKYQSVTTNEIIQKVVNYALGINTMKSRRNSKLDVDDFQRFSATPIYCT